MRRNNQRFKVRCSGYDKKQVESFIAELKEVAQVDKQPVLEGNTMSCVISPLKNK